MQKVEVCKGWRCAKGGGVQKVEVCKRWRCAKGGGVQKSGGVQKVEVCKESGGVQKKWCEKNGVKKREGRKGGKKGEGRR